MTRHEYIKKQAAELYRLCEKREKLNDCQMFGGHSLKRSQALSADINWTGMQIAQTEERLCFALGKLQPEEARKEYKPGTFQTYPGIKDELNNLKFD